MMNTENKAVVTRDDNYVANLTSEISAFCSLKADTIEEKAKLFEATNNPKNRLGDCINMTIEAKDLFCEVVDCVNEETGEVSKCPRIVIIDKDGESYQAVSLGVYGAVKKLIAIFGAPTWETPLPLTIKQITKGNKKMLTFDVAINKIKK